MRLRLCAPLIVLLLAGCATTASAPSPTPTHSTTSPTATPSPSTTLPADALIIGGAGITAADGSAVLTIGEPGPNASSVVSWLACEGQEGWGGWVSGQVRTSEGGPAVQGGTEDGKQTSALVWITALTPVRTAEGISVGSTLAELNSAYGAKVRRVGGGEFSDTYQVDQTGGNLVFDVAKTGDFKWGAVNQVAQVSSLAPDLTPEPLTPSDVTPGGCA